MGQPDTLKSIIADLVAEVESHRARAYDIIGGKPGPGFDLLIEPIEPICGKWYVNGLTPAGLGFIKEFWEYQPLSNQRVAEMRKQATAWGLTYQTKYHVLSLED